MPDDIHSGADSVNPFALRQPMDLDNAKLPRGQVHIIPERCKGCDYCIVFCPKDVLVNAKAINAKGYHYPVVADGKENECVHCRFCDLICPEMAIYTEDLSGTEETE